MRRAPARSRKSAAWCSLRRFASGSRNLVGAFSPPSLYSLRGGLIKPQTKGQGMRIVDQAPIVEVTSAHAGSVLEIFSQKCLAFGRSLTEHGSAIIKRPNRPDFPIAKSASKAAGMANTPDYFLVPLSESDGHVFAYMLNGYPVGVISCAGNNEGYEHIEALACNPGLSGCGAALIERAADLSVDHGRYGRLSIESMTGEVEAVYESYGFVEEFVGVADMVLDPASSPNWHLIPTPTGPRYRMNPKLSYIGD